MPTNLVVCFEPRLDERQRQALKELIESSIERSFGSSLLRVRSNRRFVAEFTNDRELDALEVALRLQRAAAFLSVACTPTAAIGALAIHVGSDGHSRSICHPEAITLSREFVRRFEPNLDDIIGPHTGDFTRESNQDGSCRVVLSDAIRHTHFGKSDQKRVAILLPLNSALADSWEESKSQMAGISSVLRADPRVTQEQWLAFHDHSMDICQAIGIVLDEMRLGTKWFFSTMSTVSWRLARLLFGNWRPDLGDPPQLICTISGVSDDDAYRHESVFRLYIRSEDEAAELVADAKRQNPHAKRALICHSDNLYGTLTAVEFERRLMQWHDVTFTKCRSEQLRNELDRDSRPTLVFIAMYGEALLVSIDRLIQINGDRQKRGHGDLTVYLTHTITAEPVLKALAARPEMDRLAKIPFKWQVCVPKKEDGDGYSGDVLELFAQVTFVRLVRCVRSNMRGADLKAVWHQNQTDSVVIRPYLDTNDSRVSLVCVPFRNVLEEHRHLPRTGEYDPAIIIGRAADLEQREIELSLIQCDLAGHSEWFMSLEPEQRWEATEAKRSLEREIYEKLRHDFVRVDWAGDGGLYAASAMTVNAKRLVETAELMRREFDRWKATNSANLNTKDLRLRLSCHQGTVWIHDEVEFWASEDLNWFVKNERLIANATDVGITQRVYQRLGSVNRRHWVRTGRDPVRGNLYSRSPAALDIFVATPMASIPRDGYVTARAKMCELSHSMGAVPGIRTVYSAMADRASPDEFVGAQESLRLSFARISKSSALILVWDDAVPSSALVELGVALGLGKDCIVLAEDRSKLPHMIREGFGVPIRKSDPPQIHVIDAREIPLTRDRVQKLEQILLESEILKSIGQAESL